MNGRYQCFVYLLCAIALQGCGNSFTSNAGNTAAIPEDSPRLASDDDDGQSEGNGDEVSSATLSLSEGPVFVDTVGPAGDSGLVFDNTFYPLSSALGDIWGISNDHYNINFTVSNGRYRLEQIEVDGTVHEMLLPALTSAIFRTEMYSPGEQFSMMTYSFSAFGDGGGALAGNAFFINAYVGVDEDFSGDVEDDEMRAVIGGTIEFIGVLPQIELRFSVTLEEGQLVEGHYRGLFDFTNR